LIGEWFKRNPSKRADIFLTSKFGFVIGGGKISVDASPQAARQECEKSLKALGVDYIDLYYVHRVDPKVPVEITMQALVELKNEGKIRQIGLSECSAQAIRRAHAIHPIAAMQVEYAPITLDIEDPKIDIRRTCEELGIAIIPWSPLGKGILTGQYVRIYDVRSLVYLTGRRNRPTNSRRPICAV
jgi:aryl-alcohol dehydrogenase-like predicted oxidoreductase